MALIQFQLQFSVEIGKILTPELYPIGPAGSAGKSLCSQVNAITTLKLLYDRFIESKLILEPYRMILGIGKKHGPIILIPVHDLHIFFNHGFACFGIRIINGAPLTEDAMTIYGYPLRVVDSQAAFGVKRVVIKRRHICGTGPVSQVTYSPNLYSPLVSGCYCITVQSHFI